MIVVKCMDAWLSVLVHVYASSGFSLFSFLSIYQVHGQHTFKLISWCNNDTKLVKEYFQRFIKLQIATNTSMMSRIIIIRILNVLAISL